MFRFLMSCCSLLLILGFVGCGGDADAEFRPEKGKEPKPVKDEVSRSGESGSFLPSAEGGGTSDEDIFGNN